MSEINKITAVNNLLGTDTPENLVTDLTEMWEAWITSDLTDGASASQRAGMLMSYKNLCDFLHSISINNHKNE